MQESDFIPEDVLALSEKILAKTGVGLGAYTESRGYRFVREAVADFINRRDGFDSTRALKADPEAIFLTDGASDGAKRVLNLV